MHPHSIHTRVEQYLEQSFLRRSLLYNEGDKDVQAYRDNGCQAKQIQAIYFCRMPSRVSTIPPPLCVSSHYAQLGPKETVQVQHLGN